MTNQKTSEIVNQLFERLISINPAFKQAWPTESEFKATKKEWVLAFVDSGISSIEQIKSGIKKLRLDPSPFIPSPGEFIKLCTPEPEDIGAPNVDLAYDEACKKSHPSYGKVKNWSHKAVEYARNKMGAFRLINYSRAETYPDFKKAYYDAINELLKNINTNQIEQRSDRKFTDTELHWIYTFKKFGKDEHGYPDKDIAENAEKLYHEWLKTQ